MTLAAPSIKASTSQCRRRQKQIQFVVLREGNLRQEAVDALLAVPRCVRGEVAANFFYFEMPSCFDCLSVPAVAVYACCVRVCARLLTRCAYTVWCAAGVQERPSAGERQPRPAARERAANFRDRILPRATATPPFSAVTTLIWLRTFS